MISKKIRITELAGEQAFENAQSGCSSCQQGCAGKWFAPHNAVHSEHMQTPADAEIAISGQGLNTIVAVLFGLPLLLLLGIGYSVQVFGMTAAPLLSLAVTAIALLLTGIVIIKHGAKLIPLLRVEIRTSPNE